MRRSSRLTTMTTKPRRFRLTPPTPSESALHESVAQALTLLVMPGCEWACYPAGHIRLPPAAAAALHRAGLKRGWPDFILVHGRVYGIELKVPGGKLSKTRTVRTRRGSLRILEGQEDVHPRLHAAGMTIAICSSVEAVVETLRGWSIPLRGSSLTAAA
jgi:hypothetical protein